MGGRAGSRVEGYVREEWNEMPAQVSFCSGVCIEYVYSNYWVSVNVIEWRHAFRETVSSTATLYSISY